VLAAAVALSTYRALLALAALEVEALVVRQTAALAQPEPPTLAAVVVVAVEEIL
jgi:hypothetical protein